MAKGVLHKKRMVQMQRDSWKDMCPGCRMEREPEEWTTTKGVCDLCLADWEHPLKDADIFEPEYIAVD